VAVVSGASVEDMDLFWYFLFFLDGKPPSVGLGEVEEVREEVRGKLVFMVRKRGFRRRVRKSDKSEYN
jgi:hypothetical protein